MRSGLRKVVKVVVPGMLGLSLVSSPAWMAAGAQRAAGVLPSAGLPGPVTLSVDQYRDHLHRLQSLVDDCKRNASACDPARVGDDDRVRTVQGREFIERFGWLRDLLHSDRDPDGTRRSLLLPAAAERLAEDEAAMAATAAPAPAVTEGERSRRASVLARSEFRMTGGYSLSERISAWISDLIGRFFGSFARLGRVAPWLGAALQWGSLIVAALVAVLWFFRVLDRSRVGLGRLHGASSGDAAEQQAESRAWAETARGHADRAEWRDAVHALYWASVIALEDRRTLRRSNTRTPREALRLIDPASHLRGPLEQQTGSFERIWYGHQAAQSSDYDAALSSYRELQAGTAGRGAA